MSAVGYRCLRGGVQVSEGLRTCCIKDRGKKLLSFESNVLKTLKNILIFCSVYF